MTAEKKTGTEQTQKELFNRISAVYEQHYSDTYSQRYRQRFMYMPMMGDIDFKGLSVLEAMCGSGEATEYLLTRGAKVTGLDMSSKMIESFKKRWLGCRAVCASILDSGLESESFDCVVVIGGFHHLPPHVDEACDKICRLLKPGGWLLFCEPHAGSLPDTLRRLWYRADKYFEKNEEAVDLEELQSKNSHRFDFDKTKYGGNIAYMFIYNSMIFRIPLGLKRYYSPLLMTLESVVSAFQGKRLSCFALCRWKKK